MARSYANHHPNACHLTGRLHFKRQILTLRYSRRILKSASVQGGLTLRALFTRILRPSEWLTLGSAAARRFRAAARALGPSSNMPDVMQHEALARPSISVAYTYRLGRPSRLAVLSTQYGSDKGWAGDAKPPWPWPPHNYTEKYESLFEPLRLTVRTVVECGIGTNDPNAPSSMGATGVPGASLRVWRDYFPNAQVIGLDVDSGTMFSEERIHTYIVDQTDPISIAEFWATSGIDDVDIMIDDGLHTVEAGKTLFEHSIQHIRPGGLYIIEDLPMSSLEAFRDVLSSSPHWVEIVRLLRSGLPFSDNSLVVVRLES